MDNTNDTVKEEVTTVKKKRGRPATGAKTEAQRIVSVAKSEVMNLPQFGGRPDDKTVQLLSEALTLIDTPAVDVYNPEEVKERSITYLQKCVDNHRRPAIAAYALYLGLDRRTLNGFIQGLNKAIHPDSLSLIKYVYSLVDYSMEQQMQDGEMNVVAGIFLMRNNLGYTNVDTVEIVPKTQEVQSVRLDDVIAEYSNDSENKE